jgi:hypothetical protein
MRRWWGDVTYLPSPDLLGLELGVPLGAEPVLDPRGLVDLLAAVAQVRLQLRHLQVEVAVGHKET